MHNLRMGETCRGRKDLGVLGTGHECHAVAEEAKATEVQRPDRTE